MSALLGLFDGLIVNGSEAPRGENAKPCLTVGIPKFELDNETEAKGCQM